MFKNLIYAAAGFSLLFTSCTEDVMDHINRDEANPPASAVSAKFMITDAINATAISTWGGAYAWYTASFTEQIFGTGNNQLMQAELRMRSQTASSSTFNNEWNLTYGNLNNIAQILQKTSPGGLNEGQLDLRGMAQTLWVLNFEALTDLHGDIPYSEALDISINAPQLQSQESIYADLLNRADQAIADLTAARTSGLKNGASQDLLFHGNLSQWLGLAHATKARLLLNTSFRNPSVWPQVIAEGEAALAEGFGGAQLEIFNGVDADNSWTAFQWSRQYSGSCETVVDLFAERSDPRADIYAVNVFSAVPYAPAGDQALATATETVGFPAWLDNGAAPLHIFSLAELHFILAEAKARTGADPAANFEAAIAASFADYGTAALDSDLASKASDYIATLGAPTLQEIMVQKYLAQTRDEQIQTYNDLRRCRAMGETHITLHNPNNTVGGVNQWPLRLPYGNSDVISNPNVAAAFGTGNDAGNYLFTDPVWLFGGTR